MENTTLQRFESKFVKTDNCWLWKNPCKDGYGKFWINGKKIKASRASYILYKENISAELSANHTCNNPRCVNPEHIYAGTHKENMKDMLIAGNHNNARKTHCKRGHEFTEENIYYRPTGRECKNCIQLRNNKSL